MSSFLGPIHYMMYERIKALNETEALILERVSEKLGFEPDPKGGYGYRCPEENLEDIINPNGIHGWLQEKVDQVEMSLSSLIKAIFEKYREKGMEVAIEAAGEAARKTAGKVPPRKMPGYYSAEEAAELLEGFLLNGMPCDRGVEVVGQSGKSLQLRRTISVHDRYWKKTGVPSKLMMDINERWVREFIARVAPKTTFRREVTYDKNGGYVIDEISAT